MSQIPAYNPDLNVLVLAPHLLFPPTNGADLLVEGRWQAFSQNGPDVRIVGCEESVLFRNGLPAERARFSNVMRSKVGAVARTLARGSHYLYEKFLTRAYVNEARSYLQDPQFGTIVTSYLCTASKLKALGKSPSKLSLVETHNDDFKWFEDIRRSTRNPLVRRAAVLSRQWTETYFRRESRDHVFLHVTESDRRGYAAYDRSHQSLIAPVGVHEKPPPEGDRREDNAVRLLFVGSLATSMNFDALSYFSSRFFPALQRAFGERLSIHVVGSNPSRRVSRMCRRTGWDLSANVSTNRLAEIYGTATFTLLPFAYATGAKLKVLESLSFGVPFLGTARVRPQLDTISWPCLLSDDPGEWVDHIEGVVREGISRDNRAKLVDLSRPYTWNRIAERLHQDLLALTGYHGSN